MLNVDNCDALFILILILLLLLFIFIFYYFYLKDTLTTYVLYLTLSVYR